MSQSTNLMVVRYAAGRRHRDRPLRVVRDGIDLHGDARIVALQELLTAITAELSTDNLTA